MQWGWEPPYHGGMAQRVVVVGRDTEQAVIGAFVQSITGPGVLLIEGDAGMGKSMLWESGLAAAGGDVTVLSCRPVRSEATLSFVGLGDLLTDVVRTLMIDLAGPQRRALGAALLLHDADDPVDHRAVGAGTLSLLQRLALDGPVLVAVDDLQWLDRASGRALGFALRRLSDERVGLLAATRSGPRGTRSDVAEALRERSVGRVRAGPLSLGAVERILADRLELTLSRTALVHLHDTSGGNPYYAIELGRALIEGGSLPGPGQPQPVPVDLQTLVLRRVHRLPADARDALLLASLLSNPRESVLAEAFGSGWAGAVAHGCGAGVVEIVAGMVRFVHPLVAAAVAVDASDEERRNAHGRLAGSSEIEAEVRARHLALAATGPDETVAAALEEASIHATGRGAPDAAAELAELARTMTPGGRPHDVCRRYTLAGEARFAAGDSVRALELFAEAGTVAAQGRERGGVLWRAARVRYHHDDVAASRRTLEEALDEAGDDIALRAAIERDLAYTCLAMVDARAMLRHAGAAVDLAERVGADAVLADALGQVAASEFLLGLGIRSDLMDRARRLEDWDRPGPVLLRGTIAVAHVLSWTDCVDDARALLEGGERRLVERGDTSALPFLWYHLAELDCWNGEWERGYERASEADRLAIQTGQTVTRSLTCYAAALLAAHLGRVDEARAHAREGVKVAMSTGHLLGVGLNMSVVGFVELSLAHPDRAHAVFGPIIEGARAGGFEEPGSAWWLADEIEALVALGDHGQAESLTGWLEERALAIDRPTGLALAARCRALLGAARSEMDAALLACDEALGQHDRVGVPFQRGRTLFVKGQIARRARKWGVARGSLGESLAVFERLGAALWVARAQEELARIGGRRVSQGYLTHSERKIAELVASGSSNREVAEALFVSARTVEASLARVFRKLGVASRTEMAARMRNE